MPILHLPADHSDADLVLAAELADRLGSSELYVAWSPSAGQAAPALSAQVREPASRWSAAIALAVRAVAELWVRLTAPPGRRAAARSPAPRPTPDAPRSHPAPGEAAA